MDPMRLITYTVLAAVVTLVAMGGVGFYAGYSAGRGDLEEVKTLIAASASPEHAATLSELLKKPDNTPAAAPDLSPVLQEIRSLSTQIGRLEQTASTPDKSAARDDTRLRDELTSLRQRLTAASDQYSSCKQDMNLLEARLRDATPAQAAVSTAAAKANADAPRDPASVVLFDNVQLKRDQNKLYNDVDVALSLQAVASRSARVAVNQQSFGISFGERKIFQHKDVTCELVLMETDLEGNQARLSIACKR
jgi:DNA repair exonuclease SbcCD ATPase subunit